MRRGDWRRGYVDPRLAATEHPTVRDIAWAAGLFEGEGHCRRTGYTAIATIAQNDQWVLWRMRALFGGSVFQRHENYEKRDGTKTNTSSWNATGTRARGFLMTIYVFLSPRRQAQVRVALGVEVPALRAV